ncbi:(2Fe-2S) ferredoxin domain-containing protein [uncultured Clostridium sp.]|uniref:(2Fe-2S) ferredoxin domain-containing protein n=1 Tax=uncultured Clostridium sp. TaxID=59620 RepID=UPI0028E2EA8B|nr:(2Fe-2S) ferredoxin domain-containing protein [uncultured Clostridium sp.]
MKTIEELNEIRKNTFDKVNQGRDRKKPRIVVGMATCGIAAGSKYVMEAIEDEIRELGIEDVDLVKAGCIGMCRLEPIVEVIMPGHDKVTYVKMSAMKARRVIREHIRNGKIIEDYTMHVIEDKIMNDYVVLSD